MIYMSWLFLFIGYTQLFMYEYHLAIVSFLFSINFILWMNTTNYFQSYLFTNQFTDGQHAAIEQYNEDTKS